MRIRDRYIQQAIDILQEHYITGDTDDSRLQWAIETAIEVMREVVESED